MDLIGLIHDGLIRIQSGLLTIGTLYSLMYVLKHTGIIKRKRNNMQVYLLLGSFFSAVGILIGAHLGFTLGGFPSLLFSLLLGLIAIAIVEAT